MLGYANPHSDGFDLVRPRLCRTGRIDGGIGVSDFDLVAQAAEELQQQNDLPCRLVHLEPLVDRGRKGDPEAGGSE
jgi:hypothetical protein